MKKHVPNIITLLNVSCGVIAVLIAITQTMSLTYAIAFIFLGAVFDFLDGFAARLLKAYSPMGKELDSLADLITFGFAPAALISSVIVSRIYPEGYPLFLQISGSNLFFIIAPYIIVPFSALRLAKFNVDTRQSESFIGLPTPANAIFMAGLVFFAHSSFITNTTLIILSGIFSLLLISEIPMFSLKFKSFSFSKNILRYSFLIIAVILFIIFQEKATSIVILFYILLSIAVWLLSKK